MCLNHAEIKRWNNSDWHDNRQHDIESAEHIFPSKTTDKMYHCAENVNVNVNYRTLGHTSVWRVFVDVEK